MIEFHYPELLLVGIPLAYLFWRFALWGKATAWLRGCLALLLLLALAGPLYNLGGRGVDVIVVADRSRSLTDESHDNIRELIRNLERNRGRGDRVGLVTFGAEARVERLPSMTAQFENYFRPVNVDGSDLNAAIQVALNLSDEKRPTRILVFSDGEATGQSPLTAARRSRELGIPIDYRSFSRVQTGDLAVDNLSLPEQVSPREPFQLSVTVQADRPANGTVILRRNGEVIASSERRFQPGRNRLLFRDLVDAPGFQQYEAELVVPGDPVPENNRGEAGLRVEAGPRVLVLTTDGQPGNLVQSLRAARLDVDVVQAGETPLTQDLLDPYRAVILENVPARDLGFLQMQVLAQYVEDLGGGLLMTGGQRSFGVGGYHNSPLDEILPVSTELREEKRKNRVAISVALDRSGSMMMPVAGGKTKMDLANLGTAECVRLLSPGDSISVLAVDTVPHIIVPQTNVDNPDPLVRKVLGIQSMGGGIYVYDALVAAGKELMKAEQTTKHIILFSDAADSEQPGNYKQLLSDYEKVGITVSVIALGTTRDVDAQLLIDIAKRGSGNIMFTEDAAELPRLFSEDAMAITRNTFIEKDPDTQPEGIPGMQLSDARLIGDWGSTPFPHVDGYNLCYLRPEATMGVVTQDEHRAPLSAFWYRGLGRVAALTVEVDGPFSGTFNAWEEAADFLVTQTRWLLGGDAPDQVYLKMQREGQDAVATLELDPRRADRGGLEVPQLMVVAPGAEREDPLEPEFSWIGPDTLQSRFRMDRMGTYRTLVRTGARQFQRGPTVSLPYSPEFAPRTGLPSGREILSQMAELTGGEARTNLLEMFRNAPRSPQKLSLVPYLMALALVLLILEIGGRRLSWWGSWRRRAASVEVTPSGSPTSRPISPSRPGSMRPGTTTPVTPAASAARPTPAPPKEPPAEKPKVDIFAQAKNRAKKRME